MMKSELAERILNLKGSTTVFLEDLQGSELRIQIVSQQETGYDDNVKIQRHTKLYFDNPNNTILYCVSSLNRKELSSEEYKLLINTNIPIGHIFQSTHKDTRIEKKNIKVEVVNATSETIPFDTKSHNIYKKTYEYWLENRFIGIINEIFTEDSLSNICRENKDNDIIAITNKIISTGNDNFLTDGNVHLKYSQLYEQIRKIEEHIAAEKLNTINCLALNLSNSIYDILLFISLIRSKTSVYIINDQDFEEKKIPTFCEKTLSLNKITDKTSEIIDRLDVTNNPNFIGNHPGKIIESSSVIFASSGSTGRPKYIKFNTITLLKNSTNCIKRLNLTRDTIALITVPINHMYGLAAALLPSLLSHSNISIIEKTNVIKISDFTTTYKPDITYITPSICKMMLLVNKKNTNTNHSIYVTAGDAISKITYQNFEQKFGKLINLYGCTELGAIATSSQSDNVERRTSGIIKTLPAVKILVDGPLKGEILCQHNAPFDYYLDHNGNKIPADNKYDKWHQTKDLGITTDHDSFEVLGRLNFSTNRNGFLVTFQEIEEAIENTFPAFKKVLVIQEDVETLKGKRLTAICEVEDKTQHDAKVTLQLCKGKIVNHLIPDQFYFTKSLPRLPNNKLNRNFNISILND